MFQSLIPSVGILSFQADHSPITGPGPLLARYAHIERVDTHEIVLQISKVPLRSLPSTDDPRLDGRVEHFKVPDQRELRTVESQQKDKHKFY